MSVSPLGPWRPDEPSDVDVLGARLRGDMIVRGLVVSADAVSRTGTVRLVIDQGSDRYEYSRIPLLDWHQAGRRAFRIVPRDLT